MSRVCSAAWAERLMDLGVIPRSSLNDLAAVAIVGEPGQPVVAEVRYMLGAEQVRSVEQTVTEE